MEMVLSRNEFYVLENNELLLVDGGGFLTDAIIGAACGFATGFVAGAIVGGVTGLIIAGPAGVVAGAVSAGLYYGTRSAIVGAITNPAAQQIGPLLF